MINMNMGLSGQYRCLVTRNGKTVHDTGFFDNLITDDGMHRIGIDTVVNRFIPEQAFNDIAGRFVVGTGTAAPAVGNKSLGNQIAMANADSVFVGHEAVYSEGRYSLIVSHTFPAGAVVGNVSEIGLRPDQYVNELFSRSLVVGGDGTPQPVTVTSADVFACFYKFTVTYPKNDQVFQIYATVNGEPKPTTVIFRPLNANDALAWVFKTAHTNNQIIVSDKPLVAPTDSWPSGVWGQQGYLVPQPYNNDFKKYVKYMVGELALNDGLIATAVVDGMLGHWQVSFSPPLQKNSVQPMELTFGYSWARQ